MDFLKSLSQRLLVLDGAIGTELLAAGIKAPLELANVDSAQQVEKLHEAYLAAGADIITTNTTCADALSLAEYGLQERSRELTLAAAVLARRAADKYATAEQPRYVVGSIGPTTRNLTLAHDTTEEQVAQAYRVQIEALIEGGVDAILVETVMDARNASVAVKQCRELSAQMPIMVSAVLSRIDGRVASGATIAKFLEDLPLEQIDVIGFNCSNGVKPIESAVKMLSTLCDKPIVAYPAAGEPRVQPNHFAKQMEGMVRGGLLNIVGGCCGTTPAYTEQLAKMASRWRPRKFKNK